MRYTTQQRRKLLAYLEAHIDETFSVHELTEALKSEGVSQSSVYRSVATLEETGELRRIFVQGSTEARYQYSSESACGDRLHLACSKCGKIFHLSDAISHHLLKVATRLNAFAIDPRGSMLYGLCEACQAAKVTLPVETIQNSKKE